MSLFCESEFFLCSEILMLLYQVFRFAGTMANFMCSTVDNVSSNTTCYWGEIFPVMTFNIKATDLVWNGYFQRDNPVFYLGPHLGITDRPPCMGDSRTNTCQPQVWYPVGQIWNSTPATFFSGVFSYSSIYRLFYL